MEFFYSAEITIPLFHILLLLVFSTVVLLYGKVKMALILNYLFTMYWGYIFNREYLRGLGFDKVEAYSLIYLALGFVIVGLALVGLFAHRD